QDVNAESVRDLVLSRSHVAALPPPEQEETVEAVRGLYAEYGRGMDGMQLPHLVRCLRTQVVHQPGLFDDGSAAAAPATALEEGPAHGPEQESEEDAARRARSMEAFRS